MIHILHLDRVPIFRQLQIEEMLLRTDARNFFIINTNAPKAIVMGISSQKERLIDLKKTSQDSIPIIKRFSGGGTVVVDEETIFTSFICNGDEVNCSAYPQTILEWASKLYTPLFPKHFCLKENDFVIGDKKVGGNAQYIKGKRWLLHTSFLWNYTPKNMEYLFMPEKRPSYRKERTHSDFLTTLAPHFPCKAAWLSSFKELILNRFPCHELSLSSIEPLLATPHRKATILI